MYEDCLFELLHKTLDKMQRSLRRMFVSKTRPHMQFFILVVSKLCASSTLKSASSTYRWNFKGLNQLCPTRGPVEGFVRPSLGVRCSKSILHTDNLSLIWYSWI